MMRVLAGGALAVLAGCATPSVDFLGATRHEVRVDDMRFAVFHRGAEAQVIRLDHASRAERAQVAGLMMRAAAQASGCRAVPNSLRQSGPDGSAVARIALDCPDLT